MIAMPRSQAHTVARNREVFEDVDLVGVLDLVDRVLKRISRRSLIAAVLDGPHDLQRRQ